MKIFGSGTGTSDGGSEDREFPSSPGVTPDPRVPAKAKRRILSGVEQAKILKDLDRLPHGGRGAYLRQLGLYSGQVSNWRKKQLEGLSANRGPKPKKAEALERRMAELERENRQLKSKLKRAELVNELQKKIAEILGDSTGNPPEIDAKG